MSLAPLELEKLELKYLKKISDLLQNSLRGILRDLRSRVRILNDWYGPFRKSARPGFRASDLDTGAERVFSYYLASDDWRPLSAPIGSDVMYETEEAIIHIEVKTAALGNERNYKGKFSLGENQTSYPGGSKFSGPNLPKFYYRRRREEKPCLTYVILVVSLDAQTIISGNWDQNPLSIALISVPNGKLSEYYGKDVVLAGQKGERKDGTRGDFTYKYSEDAVFRVIEKKENRTEMRFRGIWMNPKYVGEEIEGIEITHEKLFGIPQQEESN